MLWESRPALRSPVLIAAFHGWNDGGSAATLAASFVRSSLDAVRFASIDPDEYIDFQQSRPRVSLDEGLAREISWPEIEFFHAALPGASRDIVICIGTEPNLRWKAFTNEIADLVSDLGVDLALTLGGLLADTPHTRPVPVPGTAHDGELARRFGLRRSRYEGPTGIVGVLHDTFARRNVPSASLWAAVPHYIAANTNPAAALALVRQLEGILEVRLHPDELEAASKVFLRQIAQVLESDAETAAYVSELERRGGDEDGADESIPTGDELAEELQRFLRERRERPDGY